ncbi:MAG: Uncharacterized protein XD42_1100 [Thermodesulfobacterium sp. 37_54]|jgi:hypothetical protein|uniref:hypothetical protein n=1 Tax=Thermodesulfobacterium TaxID=1740 RepID=UPI000748E3AC|nr:hypothetical protein [Thermodesulfobacterium sp.]KUJ97244.1 MAG: Uncharacterized protein XD42_1100 [Thermodesulfobacterium sp. 37_54]KUK19167.1 MAG: Uncharacterized protein XD55_0777 [Thermodesulfobacterium commune]MDN5380503.1 hypothetical protein [Thermodesulfobacterium sp.]HBT04418.1 hypothetical protein [Thermodesulfobacterium commune]HCE79729.1 hypothetical protein [Thermodesulfobacterium commune]
MNKKLKFFVLGFLILLLLSPLGLKAENLKLGVSFSEDKITHFYLAISNYFQVPKEKIVILKKGSLIKEEELPLVLYLSQKKKVSPEFIIELRNRGYSWYEIFIYLGLKPEKEFEKWVVIYQPAYGPPYGKAWGYHKKHPTRKIVFTDHDLIILSNVHFMSNYYQINPIEIKQKFDTHRDILILHEHLFRKKHRIKSR